MKRREMRENGLVFIIIFANNDIFCFDDDKKTIERDQRTVTPNTQIVKIIDINNDPLLTDNEVL